MNPIPPNLDEADLIALIEGEQVINPRAVRAAIEADHDFGRLLVEMRADRATLRAMHAGSALTAPASILEGVEARLEQDALAGIVRSEPTVTSLPISASPVITRPTRFQQLLESRSVRRYAMAAGLALVGGVSLLFVASAVSRAISAGQNPRPVAVTPGDQLPHDDGYPYPIPSRNVADNHGSTSPFDPASFAIGDDRDLPRLVSRPEDAPSFNDPISPAMPIADAGITLARALELARDGRLVIRIRAQAGGAQAAENDVRALSRQSSKDVKWRTLESAPSIVTALAAKVQTRPSAPSVPDKSDQPIAATDPNSKPPVVPPQPSKTINNLHVPPDFRPLYTVEFDAAERNLESLLKNLDKGTAQSVEFVELEVAVETTPGLDPASMLWWGRKSSEWVKRIAVPIVLETQR